MQMCIDPKALEGAAWFFCYLTNPKHQQFYFSFVTVLVLITVTAPVVLALGFVGALARRSKFLWPGAACTRSADPSASLTAS